MEFRDQPSCLETDREKDGLERGGGRRRGSLLSEWDVFSRNSNFLFPKSLQPAWYKPLIFLNQDYLT